MATRLLSSLLRTSLNSTRQLSLRPVLQAKKYSEKHEWVEYEGKVAKIGITNYAQEALGELVYIQPPDQEVSQGEECGTVESVKAASDIYSPLTGVVTEANDDVITEPKLVNTNPEDLGWLFKMDMSNTSELDSLMDKAAYDEFVKSAGSDD